MNGETIKDFFVKIGRKIKTRRLVGILTRETLQDRFDRYDFEHRKKQIDSLEKEIINKEIDLNYLKSLKEEILVISFNTSDPTTASRIEKIDRRIIKLENEIANLKAIYESERKKYDILIALLYGQKDSRLEAEKTTPQDKIISVEDYDTDLSPEEFIKPVQSNTLVSEESTLDTIERVVGVKPEITQDEHNDRFQDLISAFGGTKETSYELPSAPTKANSNAQGTMSLPSAQGTSVQIPGTPNTPSSASIINPNDPDYLKLIASDKMSEFARGYKMVKREERQTRTYKFFHEITTATGVGMVGIGIYMTYGVAAYDSMTNPLEIVKLIGNDLVERISSDPSLSNVIDVLSKGPVQFLFGAVILGVGMHGFNRYKRQYDEAHARRIDMENINAVTEAPITEHIAKHI